MSAGVRLATSQTATTPAWDFVKSLTYSMQLTFATRRREMYDPKAVFRRPPLVWKKC